MSVQPLGPQLSDDMIAFIDNTCGDKSSTVKYDDIERYKFKILRILLSDTDILRTLNNKKLEEQIQDWNEPNGDIYRDVNIFSFLKIPDTQSEVVNFICFEVNDVELPYAMDSGIKKQIRFRTVSHEDDFRTDYGIHRQDLLAAIIKRKFDRTSEFGKIGTAHV